ncbi:PREDICTED: MATH domain and coiled-coil domain-containing protein At3g27040-like [Camelina sativa]|uniref:MATH domain and coiled-coil domain-containing protein At3g27040-like n=1 Tax=Camelina sativa TaxID=90675 RepID=A0ABM0TF16_CAMSA|nr:PREDICTED: MATH domain and coiled-coil domain-containing protein At3g27040-like [Camelina sativa]
MGIQADKKFTWVIKDFNSLDEGTEIYSDIFVAGRCKWRLMAYAAYPKGSHKYKCGKHLSLFLCVFDSEYLPSGWRRHAKISFKVANQIPGELSHMREAEYWFDQKNTILGFKSMIGILEIQGNGIMVTGEVKIVAKVDVLEFDGEVDVPEETEGIDINGFQVPASQVESVNSLFEKIPGFASKLSPKNPHLQNTYLNVVLNLTEILCKSPEELSNGDLAEAYSALRFVTNAGFKLDWLEKKLKKIGETRLEEIEEELKDLKVKCADMDALLEFLR